MIFAEISGNASLCKQCELKDRHQPLLLEPIEEDPRVVIVSQAPGDPRGQSINSQAYFERTVGSPMGKFIPRLFQKTNKRFEITRRDRYWRCYPGYWTHLGKCFPGTAKGGHKLPPKLCAGFLWKELEVTNPRLVVGLGCAVWTRLRRYVQRLSNCRLTDSVKYMVNTPEKPILVSRDGLRFELVPLPHPGRSGQAYWNRGGLKEMQESAIELCQDKIMRTLAMGSADATRDYST